MGTPNSADELHMKHDHFCLETHQTWPRLPSTQSCTAARQHQDDKELAARFDAVCSQTLSAGRSDMAARGTLSFRIIVLTHVHAATWFVAKG